MDQATVTCQVCREPMRPRPSTIDLAPGEWHPSGERLAALLSEFFECSRCGGLTIRPGALAASRPRAA